MRLPPSLRDLTPCAHWTLVRRPPWGGMVIGSGPVAQTLLSADLRPLAPLFEGRDETVGVSMIRQAILIAMPGETGVRTQVEHYRQGPTFAARLTREVGPTAWPDTWARMLTPRLALLREEPARPSNLGSE